MKSLGNRIKEARQSGGYTQSQLAKLMGCSVNTIARWEHDKHDLSAVDLQKLSSILDVDFNSDEYTHKQPSDLSSIEMQLEDLRLEFINHKKVKTKMVITIVAIIIFFTILFVAYTLSLQFYDPDRSDEPVHIVDFGEKGG